MALDLWTRESMTTRAFERGPCSAPVEFASLEKIREESLDLGAREWRTKMPVPI